MLDVRTVVEDDHGHVVDNCTNFTTCIVWNVVRCEDGNSFSGRNGWRCGE